MTWVLEESARVNPDARIRPLTHVSVDRAYQAESVGGNSLVTILIAIRRSPNLWVKISGEIASRERNLFASSSSLRYGLSIDIP